MVHREYFSRRDFRTNSDSRKRVPTSRVVDETQARKPVTKRKDRQDFPSKNKWAIAESGRHPWETTSQNKEKSREEQLRIAILEALSPEIDDRILEQMQDEEDMMTDIYDDVDTVNAWKKGEITWNTDETEEDDVSVPPEIHAMEVAFHVTNNQKQTKSDKKQRAAEHLFNDDSRGRYRNPGGKNSARPFR